MTYKKVIYILVKYSAYRARKGISDIEALSSSTIPISVPADNGTRNELLPIIEHKVRLGRSTD